jgi:hypothetical protein
MGDVGAGLAAFLDRSLSRRDLLKAGASSASRALPETVTRTGATSSSPQSGTAHRPGCDPPSIGIARVGNSPTVLLRARAWRTADRTRGYKDASGR